MFGEFTDEPMMASSTHETSNSSSNGSPSDPIDQQIASLLAGKTEIILKSQQRGEPDFTYEQRREIALSLIRENPSQFLYRYLLVFH